MKVMKDPSIGFFNWIKLMLVADGKNVTEISGEIDVTYSHAHALCQKLVDLGWLKQQKVGRTQIISYTSEGEKVSQQIKVLTASLKTAEEKLAAKNIKSRK
jgi:DNA-binding MarR family transcriptional regulator